MMVSKKRKVTLKLSMTYFRKVMLNQMLYVQDKIKGIGGFQKSYVIFGGGMSKYLLFLTGVGGWSGKGQK